MITLYPPGPRPTGATGELDDDALAALYAYPPGLTAPYVRVNFVASIDGAATVEGRSEGLGSPADRRVFGTLRRLADVVLVGAGTARVEDYRGARRPVLGTSTPPPIAVVSGRASIAPDSRLLTDTVTPPIILTTAAAPQERRDALAAAGADVTVLESLGGPALLAELGRRGLNRVLCEGGPSLNREMIAGDLVDEMCLTIAPVLAGGGSIRIVDGPGGTPPRNMELATALHEDGVLLLRYRRLLRSSGAAGGSDGHPRPNVGNGTPTEKEAS